MVESSDEQRTSVARKSNGYCLAQIYFKQFIVEFISHLSEKQMSLETSKYINALIIGHFICLLD